MVGAMGDLPHHIIDDFLPGELNRALLNHAIAATRFAPGRVVTRGELKLEPSLRKGMLSEDRLEPFLPQLRAALLDAFPAICDALGIPRFAHPGIEYRLVAHGDGDFFAPHHDVLTGAARADAKGDRVITAVYYFHRLPRNFTGGELMLHPWMSRPAVTIEPQNNRLAAFPSLLIHEVKAVNVPGQAFEDSRFSVTFWYTKPHGAAR